MKKYYTTTINQRAAKDALHEILNIDSDMWSYPAVYFSPEDIIFQNIDGNKRYGPGLFPQCSRRDAIQLFANSLGAAVVSRTVVKSNYDGPYLTNTIKIVGFDGKPPKNNAYTLKIENVMKDSIVHKMLPARLNVSVETRIQDTFYDSSTQKQLALVKSEDFYTDYYQYQTQEYHYTASLIDIFDSTGIYKADLRPEVAFITLESDPSTGEYPKGITRPIMGYNLQFKPQTWPDRAYTLNAQSEIIRNPAMSMGDGIDAVRKYYRMRHTLKMKYRGDLSLNPCDKIWFQYADGKKVPCQVIENDSVYNGTLSGDITLKILLTDEEIAAL